MFAILFIGNRTMSVSIVVECGLNRQLAFFLLLVASLYHFFFLHLASTTTTQWPRSLMPPSLLWFSQFFYRLLCGVGGIFLLKSNDSHFSMEETRFLESEKCKRRNTIQARHVYLVFFVTGYQSCFSLVYGALFRLFSLGR